jgi:hypothetical protein
VAENPAGPVEPADPEDAEVEAILKGMSKRRRGRSRGA